MQTDIPTSETDPNSIAALFEMDPEDLTDDDIDSIVNVYRKKRKLWMTEEKVKKAKGRSTVGTKEVPQNLSLEDIL